MSAARERQLLARANDADDTTDLAAAVTAVLGGARASALDLDAYTGLIGAAITLGDKPASVYRADGRGTRRYRNDRAFIAAVIDADDDIADRHAAAARLRTQTAAALGAAYVALAAARCQLAAAYAMTTRTPCRGCHLGKAAAICAAEARIRDAQERIGCAEAALEVLGPLLDRLRHAQARIRDVPPDLADAYELIYRHRRRGRTLPADDEFITGAQPPAAR